MLLLKFNEYEVKELPNTGKGLFTKIEIPAHTPIADYLGTVLAEDDDAEPNLLYAFGRNSTEIIWPKDIYAVGAHTINHSCASNCMFYPYDGHILIVSLRQIFPGEELTCEYFIEAGMLDAKEDPHTCHCGSKFCRGTLSSPYEYFEEYSKLLETPEMEEKIVELGSDLQPLKNYPDKVKPLSFMRLIGNSETEAFEVKNLFLLKIEELKKLISSSGKMLKDSSQGLILAGVDYNNSLLCLKILA